MIDTPVIHRREASAQAVDWPPTLPELLRRIYARRGLSDAGELDLGLARLLTYRSFKNIDAATDLLHQALRTRARILIVGDFDADGATATALAVHGLRRLGAASVDYLVPDRFRHGYGLSPAIVELAAARSPDLIVTVDNGIASVDGVAAAAARGIDVLVTDHHLPGQQLPDAAAIVNPNQPGCGFASRSIAGVGVIFYVLTALRARLRDQGGFGERGAPNMADYLDLVALGTVADVVPLDHNNRILVAQGLARIRRGLARPGVRALAQVAGRDPARLTSADIGFGLAPRLNAAGRLQDMGIGIQCLLAETDAQALDLAQQLHQLNAERRQRQQQMQDQALAALADISVTTDMDCGLCLFEPDWHEGIVGLVAGQLRERYFRPAVAFAPAGAQTGLLKGSARSIPGVHIRDVLAGVDAAHPGLIARFGGHAMAAGLSLAQAHLDAFRRAFNAELEQRLAPDDLRNQVDTDGPLAPHEFDLAHAALLRDAGPWGQRFEPPSFDGLFRVLDQRIVGERHLKLRLLPEQADNAIDAIFFGRETELPATEPVHLVYRLEVNEYQGTQAAQLVVTHVGGPVDTSQDGARTC